MNSRLTPASLDFPANQAFMTIGHCSHSMVQVYVPGGICVGDANDPAIPLLPDHIINVRSIELAYAEGVLLACGNFNSAPCHDVSVGVR